MKTLILNGSPRKGGDTAALIAALRTVLKGEVREIRAFDETVRPCVDCRFCRIHAGCAIQDRWQEIRDAIAESDCIIIASPVWFGALPGELLSMLSRLQADFSARVFRGEKAAFADKKGGILLASGGTGGENSAARIAGILLKEMGVSEFFSPVCAKETDRRPAAEEAEALVQGLAEFLNKETK